MRGSLALPLLLAAVFAPEVDSGPVRGPRAPAEPESDEQRAAREERLAAQRAQWALEDALRAAWREEQDRLDREERAVRVAAEVRCARCNGSGVTTRHRNGRPAKPHRCPECRDARKRWGLR